MDVAQNNRKQIHHVRAEMRSRVFIGLLSRIPSDNVETSLLPTVSNSSPAQDARNGDVPACSSILREGNAISSGALHTAHKDARPTLPAPGLLQSRVLQEVPTRLHETAMEPSASPQ